MTHAVLREAARLRSKTGHFAADVLVFLVALFVLGVTAQDYGLTYDEPIYLSKSLLARQWVELLAGGEARWATSEEGVQAFWEGADQHPGVVKLLNGLIFPSAARIFPPMAAMRIASPFFLALAVLLVFAYVRGRYGSWAGVYAAGSLFFLPRVFAHGHLLTMDVPVMAMNFATVVAFLRSTREGGWRWPLAAGITYGVALGCKMNAFFTIIPILIWWLIFHRRNLGAYLLGFGIAAPAIFFLTWPWLWHDTLHRLGDYLLFHGKHWRIGVEYMGRIYRDPPAPWHYPLVMSALTAPLTTLALWLTGIVLMVRRTGTVKREDLASGSTAQAPTAGGALAREEALILMALAVHFGFSMLPFAPKYNGVRLFLSVFPLLAVAGGAGFSEMINWLRAKVPGLVALKPLAEKRWMAPALGAALLLGPAMRATGAIHPYQMAYYNQLVGGPAGAQKRGFELAYWGDPYLEGGSWLDRRAAPGSVVCIIPAGVQSIMEWYQNSGVLQPDIYYYGDPKLLATADFVCFQTRRDELPEEALALLGSQEPDYAVRASGAALLVIYRKETVRLGLK